MQRVISLTLAALVLAAASPAMAKKSSSSTAPGKYTEWNGEIDELEIVTAFKIADFTKIVVQPFDVSATPLPDAKDNTFEPVKAVLAHAAVPFTEGLRDDIESKKMAVTLANDAAPVSDAQTIVVKCVVDTMDPGSKAARYWGGFGAGAARVKLVCDVNDAASGNALLHFSQERRAGVGAFGGDYEKLMNKDLTQIGNDLAAMLKVFE